MDSIFDELLVLLDVPHTKGSGWYEDRKKKVEQLLERQQKYELKYLPDGTCVITLNDKAYLAGKDKEKADDLIGQLNNSHRPNITQDGDALFVCWNNHEKGEKCEYHRVI